MNENLIDLAEASRIAKVDWATLYYHSRVGHLPTQKYFKNRLVSLSDLVAFLERKDRGDYKAGRRRKESV